MRAEIRKNAMVSGNRKENRDFPGAGCHDPESRAARARHKTRVQVVKPLKVPQPMSTPTMPGTILSVMVIVVPMVQPFPA